ncbi:hypothetical protein [Psychrobacter sp. I-STPA10]|uniref:hypothetical protein n=1 Tax=Psychrobacter sp. I-STPA10 TaxID=2585769 RepID=UPI001E630AC1|nr:hypothetical protein [Psychrobacter sp. I-STPA10]
MREVKNMGKKYTLYSLVLLSGVFVLGCQPQTDNAEPQTDTQTNPHTKAQTTAQAESETTTKTQSQIKGTSTPQPIDWAKIDSGVTPIAADSFEYPFALDSEPVKSYAQFFHVTPAEAQHSLTVGTASNEPLPALFDQLGDNYVSHELTDGKEVRLIVHTTADVAASEHVYVFAEPFARGLSMPVQIAPQN